MVITINRPDKRNAINREMSLAIAHALDELDADSALRVGILTGAGAHFCAGMDLQAFAEGRPPELEGRGFGGLTEMTPQKPLVAAVEGFALAGGLELALACDYLFASEHARFADTHARVGILPGWGLSQKLSRIIGINRAREMSLTGNFIDAHRAEAWGLVNRICEPETLVTEAMASAGQIADSDPRAFARLKSLMNDGSRETLGDALVIEGERGNAFAASVDYSQMSSRLAALRQRAGKQ